MRLRFFGPNFQSKTGVCYTAMEFYIFELFFLSNFTWTNNFEFLDQICPRKIWSKTEKLNIIIEFRLFKLVLVPNFSLNWQFWFFWPDLPKKGFSGLKQKKWTPHIFYIILHIQISLVRNWIKFAQKGISGQKLKKLTSLNFAYLN